MVAEGNCEFPLSTVMFFENSSGISIEYTCDGEGAPLPLVWKKALDQTELFVLSVDDCGPPNGV